MKLRVPMANKKNFAGLLKGMEGEDVLLENEAGIVRFALSNIEKARLQPEL